MPPLLFGGGGSATAANQTNIEAKIDIIDANVDTLVQRATADAGSNATTVVAAELSDYGDDYFNNGWQCLVIQNVGTPGAAPENEWRDITNYVSTTGTFTVDAFSAAVQEGDYFMVARDEVAMASMSLTHQDPAWIDQTAVQNTWYTVYTTTERGMLHRAGFAMQTLAEDLEIKVTINGFEYAGAQAAAVAGTNYQIIPHVIDNSGLGFAYVVTSFATRPLYIPYNTLLVEVRKTSANGANQLNGYVMNSKWEH